MNVYLFYDYDVFKSWCLSIDDSLRDDPQPFAESLMSSASDDLVEYVARQEFKFEPDDVIIVKRD